MVSSINSFPESVTIWKNKSSLTDLILLWLWRSKENSNQDQPILDAQLDLMSMENRPKEAWQKYQHGTCWECWERSKHTCALFRLGLRTTLCSVTGTVKCMWWGAGILLSYKEQYQVEVPLWMLGGLSGAAGYHMLHMAAVQACSRPFLSRLTVHYLKKAKGKLLKIACGKCDKNCEMVLRVRNLSMNPPHSEFYR